MKDKVLLSICFLLGLFLPDNPIGYIIQAILPIILFWRSDSKIFFKYSWIILLVIIISFIINTFMGDTITEKSATRLFSYTILFAFFPFAKYTKIPNIILYFAVLYILISQIAFSYNIPFLVNYFDVMYPYSGEASFYMTENIIANSGELDAIIKNRFGGLYRNPNVAVSYITLIMLYYFIENRETLFARKILFILLAFCSIFLSGSRTGLAVAILIIVYNFIFYKNLSRRTKITFAFLSVIGGVMLISIAEIFDLRAFAISEGFDDSMTSKFRFFSNFYTNFNSSIRFLIGHFSSDTMENLYGVLRLDSELTGLFYSFGIAGYACFILFYYKISNSNNRVKFALVILLWAVSASVILSFKMSFLFLLILSVQFNHKVTS